MVCLGNLEGERDYLKQHIVFPLWSDSFKLKANGCPVSDTPERPGIGLLTLVACPAPACEYKLHFMATLHTPTSIPLVWLQEASSRVSICFLCQKQQRDQRRCQRMWEREEEKVAEGTGKGGSCERGPDRQPKIHGLIPDQQDTLCQ